jgi:drug/metabolite transporter (DMT)-like permease
MVIASGSIHAVVNAIIKGRRDVEAEHGPVLGSLMAARATTDGASAILLLPVLPFVPLPTGAWGWLAGSAAVHLVYLYAMMRAYASSDFSAIYPAMRGTAPLLTALVAVGLLGEAVAPGALIGIALIGVALLALVIGRHLGIRALGWALTTGTAIAAYTVLDAQGVRAAPSVWSYIVWDFVLIGGLSLVMFSVLTRGAAIRAVRTQWRPGATAGALSVVTYGLALWAFSMGPTAPLAALRETGMVTALLLSVVFLGERVTLRRGLAVFGILSGAGLILLA